MAEADNKTVSSETKSTSKAKSTSVSKVVRSPRLWKLVIVVLAILGAYALGNHHGQTAVTSKPLVLNGTSTSVSSKPPTPAQLQAQSKKTGQTPAAHSNGFLSLAGTVTAVSASSISLKTANGQVITLPLNTSTHVVATSGGIKTLSGIKTGANATLLITVSPDGTFIVRDARLTNASGE